MPLYEEIVKENHSLKEENAVLRGQLEWYQRDKYGPGKSETLDRAQILMKLEGLTTKGAEPKVQTVTYERTKPSGEKRPLPAQTFAHLPIRETLVIEPEEVQAEPEAFERIGEERTFEVEVVPPQLFKREIVRPKYQRRADKTQAPVMAAAPARPVAGGYASAGLLAWIVLSKYVDHLPLFRLEQMSERWGARLSRQSMADWVRIASEWLEPIYARMLAGLLAGGYLQADETPVKCNDPDEKHGGTLQGFLWVITRPKGDVVFDWRLSRRHGELPSLLTESYQGSLTGMKPMRRTLAITPEWSG